MSAPCSRSTPQERIFGPRRPVKPPVTTGSCVDGVSFEVERARRCSSSANPAAASRRSRAILRLFESTAAGGAGWPAHRRLKQAGAQMRRRGPGGVQDPVYSLNRACACRNWRRPQFGLAKIPELEAKCGVMERYACARRLAAASEFRAASARASEAPGACPEAEMMSATRRSRRSQVSVRRR